MADIDTNIHDYNMRQTAASSVYVFAKHHPSGGALGKPAEPLDAVQHCKILFEPDSKIKVTLPDEAYVLSSEEGNALWSAMRESTKLVSRGRLIK